MHMVVGVSLSDHTGILYWHQAAAEAQAGWVPWALRCEQRQDSSTDSSKCKYLELKLLKSGGFTALCWLSISSSVVKSY